jgi:phosphoenolpyruvate-protein kinase (PTS system EI component)
MSSRRHDRSAGGRPDDRSLPAHFDFVSIGTNDLIQYTLAIDRADEAVAHLYDPWHPAVLQLLQPDHCCAQSRGRGVSVCGEMAGDPAFTDLLLAMGLRSFSMHPARISRQAACAACRHAGAFRIVGAGAASGRPGCAFSSFGAAPMGA